MILGDPSSGCPEMGMALFLHFFILAEVRLFFIVLANGYVGDDQARGQGIAQGWRGAEAIAELYFRGKRLFGAGRCDPRRGSSRFART